MDEEHRSPDPETTRTIGPLLHPGEQLGVATRATEAVLAVTDRRLLVTMNARVALDIPFEGLRRVQFDIERSRPATLVIVPDLATAEPQVLSIPPAGFTGAAEALAEIGARLARAG
jgi:hypothetical protein